MNVVFTGEGIVSAIGYDKDQTLVSLFENHTGIGTMRYLQSSHKELPVGEVTLSNEDMKFQLGLDPRRETSRTVLMGIMAVKQALAEAKISQCCKSPYRIVFISGTTVGGMDITERHFDGIESTTDLEFLKGHDGGSSTQQIAEYFGIFSEFTTISTACSSSANALIVGAEMLKAGEADIVVAGGTEALSRFHLNGFNSLMILDRQLCRPFDETRAGLNLGEGAAFLVMESEELARKRQSEIHAYLTGYGNACDAFHQTAFSDNGEGAYLSMIQALEMAHLSPDEIQYVNAHGTGTTNNDLCESVALQRVFGENVPYVSSTKSFTGHTTSASGSIETVICLLAMKNNFVPANLCWKNPMVNGIIPSLGERDVKLDNILCNSFGFGGNDSSLIISQRPSDFPGVTTTNISDADIQVVAKAEITTEEHLAAIRNYVSPIEVRRMGKLMKASLLSSLQVLSQAGYEKPDAIVTATMYGCLEDSEKLLLQMTVEGEGLLKPTYFMQSTHNTISSNIAIKIKCHGYNITYTQGDKSLEWAIRDAKRLLKTGTCKSVLVGCHDESTPLYRMLFGKMGYENIPIVHSISMLFVCGK